ncbi:hypothetical protein CF70_011815 [Cupriavidus sp. SK-3]|nr:hypothetical protein CF70_011815 [Cupriavidus sp. SK-3]
MSALSGTAGSGIFGGNGFERTGVTASAATFIAGLPSGGAAWLASGATAQTASAAAAVAASL